MRLMTKKNPLPSRGGSAASPTEEYYRETLNMRRLHVRLPAEHYKHLETMAEEESQTIRECLSEAIEEKWKRTRAKKG